MKPACLVLYPLSILFAAVVVGPSGALRLPLLAFIAVVGLSPWLVRRYHSTTSTNPTDCGRGADLALAGALVVAPRGLALLVFPVSPVFPVFLFEFVLLYLPARSSREFLDERHLAGVFVLGDVL